MNQKRYIKEVMNDDLDTILKYLQAGEAIARVHGWGRLIKFAGSELLQDTDWIKNNFVNVGKAFCAAVTSGQASPASMDYLAVGDSNQAEADGDTLLISEIDNTNGCGRQQDLTPTLTTTSTTDDTSNINWSWTVTGIETVQEIGVFNAAVIDTGTLIGRSVVAPSVGVANGDTLNGLYKVIFA